MPDKRFSVDVWRPSLETYGRVTHLTVAVHDADGRIACGPFNPTPLFEVLATTEHDPGLFVECVHRCLRAENRELPVVVTRYGLAMIGAPLVVNGEVVAAAVAGYHLSEFPQMVAFERLAQDTKISSRQLWDLARQEIPMSASRLANHGALLRVLAETVLREHERTRQHAEVSARLQAADAAKDEFLAMVSHELRGPLNAMLGWTRLLRTEHFGETARDHALDTIERNAVAQTALIEDLLDVSRIVAGGMPSRREPVDLSSSVEAAIQDIAPGAAAKQIRVARQIEPHVTIAGDASQLHRAVANVLSNAVKFTRAGGMITVSLTRSDEYVTVAIRDTGEGIKPEFLPHLFEPFRQQDASSTRVHGGLGLGLTIARHLVALHGGLIRAESVGVGQGATFTISLPLPNGRPEFDAPAWRPASVAIADATPPPPLPRDLRVVVVEDEEDARKLMHAVLGKAGVTVAVVATAEEAIAAVSQVRPHVLISDIGLPGEDGYALIQHIRAEESQLGGHIVAIALTAYAGDADRSQAIAAGYDVHLSKPLDVSRLLSTIAQLTQSPARVISFSDQKKRVLPESAWVTGDPADS